MCPLTNFALDATIGTLTESLTVDNIGGVKPINSTLIANKESHTHKKDLPRSIGTVPTTNKINRLLTMKSI